MILIFFVLGACLASFITLSAQRLLTSQLPWQPNRSYCDACQSTLCWWQLIPIIGYGLQKGRCHFCNAKIHPFFPISEFLTGSSFALLTKLDSLHIFTLAIAVLTLLFITTTDYFAQSIYPFSLTGLLPLLIISPPTQTNFMSAVIICGALSLIIFFTNGLGSGDIELIFLLCLILGWQKTILIIHGSSLLMIFLFAINSRSRLPFIPALAIFTLPIIFTI